MPSCRLRGSISPCWGIAWFINGTIIPELVVERGRTYTFLVYGGDNPNDDSNYHPFYITDSINGGRLLNTPQERAVSDVDREFFMVYGQSEQEILKLLLDL